MTVEEDLLREALPGYEIDSEIGRGAYGVVIGGRHKSLEREVAVKVLPRSFSGETAKDRFVAEARVLATLDHPHVVRIFDFVEHFALYAIVMERLSGGTLTDHVRRQRPEPREACLIALAVCGALQYAHDRGVLHRDVKPDNLMFSEEGFLKVTDFGIAKVLGGLQTQGAQPGYIIGSPSYLAPEQASGTTLTPAADVYALGLLLFELLAGELPFPALDDPVAVVYQHVHVDPRPLLEVAPSLPRELGDALHRATLRSPEERIATARDFARAIDVAATDAWGADWARDVPMPVRDLDRLLGRRLEVSPTASVKPSSPENRDARPAGVAGSTEPAAQAPPPALSAPEAAEDRRGARSKRPKPVVAAGAIVLLVLAALGARALLFGDDAPRVSFETASARTSEDETLGDVGIYQLFGTATIPGSSQPATVRASVEGRTIKEGKAGGIPDASPEEWSLQVILFQRKPEVCVVAIDPENATRVSDPVCKTIDRDELPDEDSPTGNLEDGTPVAVPGGVRLKGWAGDPDGEGDMTFHVYAGDGTLKVGLVTATESRADVRAAIRDFGQPRIGFRADLLPLQPGRHRICVYAINSGRRGNQNSLLNKGCNEIEVI